MITCASGWCEPLGGQEGLLAASLFPRLESACDLTICVLLNHQLETYGGVLQKEIKTNSAVYLSIRRKTQQGTGALTRVTGSCESEAKGTPGL